MDKIAKDDTPRYTIKKELKDVLHARKLATEIERQLKENKRLQAEKARQLQIEKDIKEKEAKRHALEKAKITGHGFNARLGLTDFFQHSLAKSAIYIYNAQGRQTNHL